MDKQERVGKVFNFLVRLVGASRYTKRQLPIFGLTGIFAIGFGLGLETTQEIIVSTASDVRMAASFAAESAGAVGLAETLAPEASARKSELKLTREQQNVVKFIAARYKVSVEAAKVYVDLAYKSAKQYKLDPHLVLAVMSIESSFIPDAQSHAGAQGLMQVLTRVHKEKFIPYGGVNAAYDPESNIKVGSQILRDYLVRNGNEAGALKSYVGAALMDNDGGYGYKVLSQKARIQAAAQGKPIPANPVVIMPILAASGPMQKTIQTLGANQTSATSDLIADEPTKAVEVVATEKATDI
jgi:soluble lytic murein transglycosylase-like protein